MSSGTLTGWVRSYLEQPAPEPAVALSDALRSVAGDSVIGVLLFGSQLVSASPDRFSAFDLVVLVGDYDTFYRRLAAGGHHRRSPWLLSRLSRVLAPNVIAFFPGGPEDGVAKCMILTEADFRRGLGPRAPDHFLKGRLVQRVALVHARGPEVIEWVTDAIVAAQMDVLRWLRSFADPVFTAGSFARRMLGVSYRGEVRPESADRVDEVFGVQEGHLTETFGRVLEKGGRSSVVQRVDEADGSWRFVPGAGGLGRAAARYYFARSKARATARWFKHVFTFNDWLTYIHRKVERRTGMEVEITPLQRRYPLLFLWPTVFRVLRDRPKDLPS